MQIGECSNKWQIITWLALRGLREERLSGPHSSTHTVSTVWHATRQLWRACCTFVLMIRQLSSLKMYFEKKIVVIFMRRNCYLAICRTELFRLHPTRLALLCLASNCSWCWAGDEGIVCRMACSSFINCRLSLRLSLALSQLATHVTSGCVQHPQQPLKLLIMPWQLPRSSSVISSSSPVLSVTSSSSSSSAGLSRCMHHHHLQLSAVRG